MGLADPAPVHSGKFKKKNSSNYYQFYPGIQHKPSMSPQSRCQSPCHLCLSPGLPGFTLAMFSPTQSPFSGISKSKVLKRQITPNVVCGSPRDCWPWPLSWIPTPYFTSELATGHSHCLGHSLSPPPGARTPWGHHHISTQVSPPLHLSLFSL